MGFTATVLHVDHGLRPDSADDARFVAEISAKLGLPCRILRARIRRRPRESLEMAARRTRLAFFSRMVRLLHLDAIATGHHADDVAETFILRMARGSGPDGLAGLKRISRVGRITFIRPFLDLRDADLRAYLRARGCTWREDSSNLDTSIPRNLVRRTIIPFLREHLDAHIVEHLCRSAAILRGELSRPAPAKRRRPPPPTPRYHLGIAASTGYVPRAESIGVLPAVCEMSRAALAGRTLELRPWRPGDRIAPTGLGGHHRKLQDVFVTSKTPSSVRSVLPVLCDASTGEVLWVPGYRIAETAAVESPTSPSWRFTLDSEPRRVRRKPTTRPSTSRASP